VGRKGRSDKFKENFGNPYYDDVFRCNICGENYNIVESVNQMPFYLCENHEYVYKKMQSNIELKNYFLETLRQNQ
jgi:predicted nucleic acid-binding Zn ribbon protein